MVRFNVVSGWVVIEKVESTGFYRVIWSREVENGQEVVWQEDFENQANALVFAGVITKAIEENKRNRVDKVGFIYESNEFLERSVVSN